MLEDRIRGFWEALAASPREALEAAMDPAPGDVELKNPYGNQVLRFEKDSDVSLFSASKTGIKLYGGVNLLSFHGTSVFADDLRAMGKIVWEAQAMNPVLKLAGTKFLLLTPQVQSVLTSVLNNPEVGGVPGTAVTGVSVFMPPSPFRLFALKTVSLLDELGIRTSGGN